MSSLYTKRGIYYYQGTGENGERVQRSLGTRGEQEARRLKRQLDRQFGERNEQEKEESLADLTERYLKRRWRKVDRDELSPRTVETDERALRLLRQWAENAYGEVTESDIEEIDLQAFKRHRLDDVAPTTVANNLRHLQSFFTFLREEDIIGGKPLDSVRIPRTRRRDVVPNKREFRRLKEWLDERIREAETPKMIHLLMKLACHTGMRLGELTRLKWERGAEDVGTGHARSYVYLTEEERTITIKFKRKLRVIPAGHVWETIETLRQQSDPSDTYVFTSPKSGSHYTVSCLCRKWKREVKKVDGLSRPYTSHSIRHGVVTRLLRQGVPVYEVGKVVGHSSEHITERYSHFIPSDLTDAMESI